MVTRASRCLAYLALSILLTLFWLNILIGLWGFCPRYTNTNGLYLPIFWVIWLPYSLSSLTGSRKMLNFPNVQLFSCYIHETDTLSICLYFWAETEVITYFNFQDIKIMRTNLEISLEMLWNVIQVHMLTCGKKCCHIENLAQGTGGANIALL